MAGPNGPSSPLNPDFIPRKHREDRGAQPPQSRIGAPAIPAAEHVVDQAAILAELEKEPEPAPEPASVNQLPTRAEAVHLQAVNTVDLLTSHTIERLDRLIKEIEAMKSTVLADNTRVKDFFAAHVLLANAAVQQTNHLETLFRDIREERSRTLNAQGNQ